MSTLIVNRAGKQWIRWLAIVLCMAAIAIGYLYWTRQNHHKVLLQHPVWHIGDWFDIEVCTRSSNEDGLGRRPWSRRVRIRYTVIGEETIYGYKCFVLTNTDRWESLPSYTMAFIRKETYQAIPDELPVNAIRSSVKDAPKMYIRQVDYHFVAVIWPYKANKPGIIPPPPPYHSGSAMEMVPDFPVMQGHHLFTPCYFAADGKLIPDQSLPPDWNSEPRSQVEQNSRRETLLWGKDTSIVRIESQNSTCRWVPGQLWWAQCWNGYQDHSLRHLLNNSYGGATFRAVLVRTSRDGWTHYPFPAVSKSGTVIDK